MYAGLFLLAYQQVENYVIAPRIDSKTLKIHPAVSFGSVLAGASVLGPVGALLALPAAATAQGVISATGERYDIEEGPLTRIGTESAAPAPAVMAATLPKHEGLDYIEPVEDDLDDEDTLAEEE